MTHTEFNEAVAELRRSHPEAMDVARARIGPVPVANSSTPEHLMQSVLYELRVWCMEVYVG